MKRSTDLLIFFALTYAVTWTCFISAVALARPLPASDPRLVVVSGLVLIGTFAPALVAVVSSTRNSGKSATTAMLARLFQWRAGARWYFFALSYMLGIKLVVAVVHRLLTGWWPAFGHIPVALIVVAIIFSTPFLSGEEIGWRGYALPRLWERFGFARASIGLGLIWALWHLPLFFLNIPGNEEYGQSFPVWALGVTALSVAFAWLYAHTNGSLLLTMLMHSAVNNIPHFSPSAVAGTNHVFSLHASLVACLTAICLWMAAAHFLVRMHKMKFSRGRGATSDPRGNASGTFDVRISQSQSFSAISSWGNLKIPELSLPLINDVG